jgi:hypothetical protein
MVTALALAILCLCLVSLIGAVVASLRDSPRPLGTTWSYDSRRPLP